MADETTTTASTGAEGTGATTQQTTQTAGTEGTAQTQQTQTGTEGQTTQQTATTDWRSGFKNEEAKKFAENSTDPEQLALRALDMRKQLATAIVKPGKDAKPEVVTAYRKALEIPETPDGYKFPDLPAGQEMTDEIKADRAKWAQRFHQNNVPAPVAAALISEFAADVAAEQAKVAAEDKRYADESARALQAKWGPEFEVNKTHAQRAIEQLAQRSGVDVEELRHIETKDGRFLFDHPAMLQIFAPYGREMQEGNLGPVLNSGQRETIETQIKTVRAAAATASAAGNSREANRLYAEEQRLIGQLNGARPVVGARGRAA